MKHNINKNDVYKVLINTALDISNPVGGTINLLEMARYLKTSRHQVKKCIDELKTDKLVELRCVHVPLEDEPYPPYWGYILTEKGRTTDIFEQKEKESLELIKECFN